MKYLCLITALFICSISFSQNSSYTIKKNPDGSTTRINNNNVLESSTARKQPDGSIQITNDYNPLESSTARKQPDGSIQITNDNNPLESSTARKQPDGSIEITNDYNPLESSTLSKNPDGSVNETRYNYSSPPVNNTPIYTPPSYTQPAKTNSYNGGAYSNPYNGAYANPKVVKPANVGEIYAQTAQNIAAALGSIPYIPVREPTIFYTDAVSYITPPPSLKRMEQYKYIKIELIRGIRLKTQQKSLVRLLSKAGYKVIDINDKLPKDLIENQNLAMYASIETYTTNHELYSYFVLKNFYGNILFKSSGTAIITSGSVRGALTKLLRIKPVFDKKLVKSVYEVIEMNNRK